ncbi:MAG: putative toxin-antitoxin system toxin component, PIN family [Anaerolineales bacterium]|nr:putative toxin-antitoxin system toxin component, PIN family [Anaerolineales bacterium]
MRVVIDTNIIVSGYLGGSLEAIIVAWKSGKFTLVVSDVIVEEYLAVLNRPKFKIERAEIEDFSALLLDRAEFVIPLEQVQAVVDDPSDDKFLDAALSGRANLIVSGDGHLLELKNFRDIPIITAREFVERLKNG